MKLIYPTCYEKVLSLDTCQFACSCRFHPSMYTVQAESEGVVLRFGKYHKTVDPGLRFKLPFGIDNVYVLPVRRQLKQEYGYGTAGGSNDSQFAESRTRSREKSMVTGDLNAAEVEWVVQYRINNARNYLFKVLDPEGTLRYLSESVMRTVIGDRTVDEVITIEAKKLKRKQGIVWMMQLKNFNLELRSTRFSCRM